MGLDSFLVTKMRRDLSQADDGDHLDALDQGGFVGVLSGYEHRLESLFSGHDDHGEDAVGVSKAAVEREFTQEQSGAGYLGNLARAEQDAQGDGEVVGGSGLSDVGGSQVDGDASHGELAARVAYGGANPFPGLLDRGIGKTHYGKGGQAGRDVDLHLDHEAVQSDDGAALAFGQHRQGSDGCDATVILTNCPVSRPGNAAMERN